MNQIDFRPGDTVVLKVWPPRDTEVTDTRNPVNAHGEGAERLCVGRETVVPMGVRDD